MEIYRSNIDAPDLLPAFPHTAPLSIGGGVTYHDVDFDTHCGYMSPDEAAILHRIAGDFPGRWLEIGAHTGWSGAHIAAAGCDLVALEPRLAEPAFAQRAFSNWERAGVWAKVVPVEARSDQFFQLDAWKDVRFAGAFVDGDHNSPNVLEDAQGVLGRLEDRAAIVFHDFVGDPVREAVNWLLEQGLSCRVFDTPQMLAVCWRGAWPGHDDEHVRNDDRDWDAVHASHADFDYERCV